MTLVAACGADDDDSGAAGRPVTGAGRGSMADAIARDEGLIGGADNGTAADVAVMDDFVDSEPVPIG